MRVRKLNDAPVRTRAQYVVYWAQMNRRVDSNRALAHADGRDPNTCANILWCFGLHDRPWPERPIFGTMRYMSLEGMKRKTNVADYIQEIERLEGRT